MIPRKKKKCKKCGEPSFLWSGGKCKSCYYKDNPSHIKKATKEINHTSQSQKDRLKEYSKLRKAYLSSHSVCEVCKQSRAIEVHHKRGRDGQNLFSHFLAVCPPCHHRIEMNPEWAKENNYSESRL